MRPTIVLVLAMALLPGCAAGRSLGKAGDDKGTGKVHHEIPNPTPRSGAIGPSAANSAFRG